MCFGPMPPDASDFPGGIPAIDEESREEGDERRVEDRIEGGKKG